jgi:hypothetical protein
MLKCFFNPIESQTPHIVVSQVAIKEIYYIDLTLMLVQLSSYIILTSSTKPLKVNVPIVWQRHKERNPCSMKKTRSPSVPGEKSWSSIKKKTYN